MRFENDTENPDFITGNEFARIGICENPIEQGTSTLLTKDKASGHTEAVGTGSVSIFHRLFHYTNSWCCSTGLESYFL